MKTIKAKVHRLPTDKTSDIISDYNGQPIPYTLQAEPSILTEGYFHLYITTDEEIKEGDWVIDEFDDIAQYNGFPLEGNERKIIATTDPRLNSTQVEPYDTSKPYGIELPQIPQSFIEEYCKAGGIDEVLVEVEEIILPLATSNKKSWEVESSEFRPKLNPDNTIIIHPVEEKMYNLTYKQLWSLFTHAQSWGYEHAMKDHVWQWKENEKGNQSIPKELNKWIEENL